MGRPGYGNIPSPGIAMHHSSAAAGTLGLCLQNSGGHVIVDNVDPSSPNAAAVCIPAGDIWVSLLDSLLGRQKPPTVGLQAALTKRDLRNTHNLWWLGMHCTGPPGRCNCGDQWDPRPWPAAVSSQTSTSWSRWDGGAPQRCEYATHAPCCVVLA